MIERESVNNLVLEARTRWWRLEIWGAINSVEGIGINEITQEKCVIRKDMAN